MQKKPRVSIIIVNFNGRHLLNACLTSLKELNFPKDDVEVILVDNCSSDDSVPYLRAHFSWVRIIESSQNLGFTGGNNIGFQHAEGKYIVFLNSDVTVEKNWLETLVSTAANEKNEKIGIISSHLRYATPFIKLTIRSEAVPLSKIAHTIDHSPIGILIEDILCETKALSSEVYYQNGFYDKRQSDITVRKTNGNATVLLPFPLDKDEHEFSLVLHGYESPDKGNIPVTLSYSGHEENFSVPFQEVIQARITIKRCDVENHLVWFVQNAGNIVLHNGLSKDRGSMVDHRNNDVREFYEEESVYFQEKKEVLATCGASCLIKREVFDQIGLLDAFYFMYYEDVEFSIRAWRAGWKILYEPGAIAYHKHRATTSAQTSSFFIEHLEKNHIALVITHFSIRIAMHELIRFFLRFFVTFLKSFLFQFKDNVQRASFWREKYEGRKVAFFFVIRALPRLFISRIKMDSTWPLDREKMKKLLY